MSDWRTYLHALPEAEVPDALWQRLRDARPARRSKPRWMPAAGLAAAVALAAVLAWPGAAPAPDSSIPAVVAMPADAGALRALDDSIALAYARNAAQEELDSLWQTRERLLGSAADSSPLLARL